MKNVLEEKCRQTKEGKNDIASRRYAGMVVVKSNVLKWPGG